MFSRLTERASGWIATRSPAVADAPTIPSSILPAKPSTAPAALISLTDDASESVIPSVRAAAFAETKPLPLRPLLAGEFEELGPSTTTDDLFFASRHSTAPPATEGGDDEEVGWDTPAPVRDPPPAMSRGWMASRSHSLLRSVSMTFAAGMPAEKSPMLASPLEDAPPSVTLLPIAASAEPAAAARSRSSSSASADDSDLRLPWLGLGLCRDARRALRHRILGLSADLLSFTEPLEGATFRYDPIVYAPLAGLLLAEDARLRTMHEILVPHTVAEPDFWTAYLARVHCAVSAAKVAAGLPGAQLPLIRSASGPMLKISPSVANMRSVFCSPVLGGSVADGDGVAVAPDLLEEDPAGEGRELYAMDVAVLASVTPLPEPPAAPAPATTARGPVDEDADAVRLETLDDVDAFYTSIEAAVDAANRTLGPAPAFDEDSPLPSARILQGAGAVLTLDPEDLEI
ncbi:Synapse-associated protein 1 [Blastocladiella emersonii ATCC 22665]|nr:Synapse-associated protein 1 [Blastocladiella emersonii ATCC 22665]